MGQPAPVLTSAAREAAEAAARRASFRVIQGGLSTASKQLAGEALLAEEAEAGLVAGEVVVGSSVLPFLVAGLVVVGVVGLGYYLYKRSHPDVPHPPVNSIDDCTPAPAEHPQKARRYGESQTCDDAVLDQLQSELQQLKKSMPPFDPKSPNSRNPKKLEKVPCSRIKARLKVLKELLAKRWEIQNLCFGGIPDTVHQAQINQIENAIKNTEALEAVNCVPGHPMAGI